MNLKKLTYYFLLAACIVFPFGNVLRIPIGSDVSVLALDVCVGLAFLTGLPYLWTTRVSLISDWRFRFFSLFLIIGTSASILNMSWLGIAHFSIACLYVFRYLAYGSLLWIADHRLQRPIAFASLCMVIIGLMQYALVPDLRPLFGYGWDEHLNRLFGTLLDPNFSGAVFGISLALFLNSQSPARFGAIAMAFVAILLTYSRSSYLMLSASVLAYAAFQKSAKIALFGILAICVGILLVPSHREGEGVRLTRTSSINHRIEEYSQALSIVQKHPLGVGLNAYRYAQMRYNFAPTQTLIQDHSGAGVPNSYLFVLATTGVLGLVAFVGFLGALGVGIVSSKNYALCAVFLGLLVHAAFENSLFYPFVLFLLMASSYSSKRENTLHTRD